MAGTLKGAVVVAVCVVLLHSSMGQQPAPAPVAVPAPPPPRYCSNCSSICIQSCQATYEAQAQKCSGILGASGDCIKGCSRNSCNGNSYAAVRDSCSNSSCTPSSCGPPCVVDCCKSCNNYLGSAYGQCMFWAGRSMNYCPPACINNCYSNCVNVTAAAPSPTAY
ncbi:hypothetical protein BS78_08G061700 [Paspalum vaginatum]|nr:hypothetical protein BS78_08G061700 [Paspalum vaginatum]